MFPNILTYIFAFFSIVEAYSFLCYYTTTGDAVDDYYDYHYNSVTYHVLSTFLSIFHVFK